MQKKFSIGTINTSSSQIGGVCKRTYLIGRCMQLFLYCLRCKKQASSAGVYGLDRQAATTTIVALCLMNEIMESAQSFLPGYFESCLLLSRVQSILSSMCRRSTPKKSFEKDSSSKYTLFHLQPVQLDFITIVVVVIVALTTLHLHMLNCEFVM